MNGVLGPSEHVRDATVTLGSAIDRNQSLEITRVDLRRVGIESRKASRHFINADERARPPARPAFLPLLGL